MNESDIIKEVKITMKTEGFILSLEDNERLNFLLANKNESESIIRDIIKDVKGKIVFLEKQEQIIVPLRIAMEFYMPISQDSIKTELFNIHRNLFSDIYSWSGTIRSVNISKDSMLFCNFRFIEKYLAELCAGIDLKEMKNSSKESIAKSLGEILCETNAIHPFRDGNGRAIRIWVQKIAKLTGYELFYSGSEEKDIITASMEGMKGNYKPMIAILHKGLVSKKREEE